MDTGPKFVGLGPKFVGIGPNFIGIGPIAWAWPTCVGIGPYFVGIGPRAKAPDSWALARKRVGMPESRGHRLGRGQSLGFGA